MNLNSIIIYACAAVVLADAIISGSYGGFLGVLAGVLFIYYVLADNVDRQHIRDNLAWRT